MKPFKCRDCRHRKFRIKCKYCIRMDHFNPKGDLYVATGEVVNELVKKRP